MELLITDVTEMTGDTFCVAGWETGRKKMIRPLPGAHFWSSALINKFKITPGCTMRCSPTSVPSTATYPHRTEDTYIDEGLIQIVASVKPAWFGDDAPETCDSLQKAFDGNVQHTRIWNGARKGVFVIEGTVTRSLCAVRLPHTALSFTVDGKLRGILQDSETKYDLPVVSHAILERYRGGGVEGVNDALPDTGELHVRVGLARAWEDRPEQCFVMINGVFW